MFTATNAKQRDTSAGKRGSGGSIGVVRGYGGSDLAQSVDSALQSKSRPNSAPLQTGGILSGTVPLPGSSQSGASAQGSPFGASVASANNASSSDSLSLVEQRLRIVKRNRSKSIDGSDGAVTAGGGGPSPSSPTIATSGNSAMTQGAGCMYPVAERRDSLGKQDQQLIDTISREVLDSLFFPSFVVL